MQTCNLVKDLLPLYVEGLTSEESGKIVEQHLQECADCRQYDEMIREDYQTRRTPQPSRQQVDELIAKLAKYQQNIKLISVLVAMFLSAIISGADVPFLSTLPFLLLTPFLSRLYYHHSLPIILSALPFGVIGAVLREESVSFIPFFTIISLITACIGVGAAVMVRHGMKQLSGLLKALYVIPAVGVLLISCIVYFSLCGNPIGYVQAMIKTKAYVSETYEPGTLTFKGVSYNFKDKQHYGEFEYIINGIRQIAPIGFYHDGEVNDYYKYVLEMQFAEERSADMKAEIAAVIDYLPITIWAQPEAELAITRDDLNHRYYHLSYDLPRRKEATMRRQQESAKLSYDISFAAFSDEYDMMAKEEFIHKAVAIQQALGKRSIPYHSIEIKALDEHGNLQRLRFTSQSSEQELVDSYRVEEMAEIPQKTDEITNS